MVAATTNHSLIIICHHQSRDVELTVSLWLLESVGSSQIESEGFSDFVRSFPWRWLFGSHELKLSGASNRRPGK